MANTGFKIIGPPLQPWINYLDRLSEQPSLKTQAGLDAVLSMVEATVAINTHVAKPKITKKGRVTRQGGRLLASLYRTSNTRRSTRVRRWTGQIVLGEGVRYAKYELGERRRGFRPDWTHHPMHDAYVGLEVYYELFDAVLGEIG